MENKKKWSDELEDRFLNISRKYDLPEEIEHDLHTFVLTVAQEQYRTGNRNGIAWLRRQLGAYQSFGAPATAPAAA
jgi:hypothetical protein